MNERDPYAIAGLEDRKSLDPQGMLERIYRYPEDLREALKLYGEDCGCGLPGRGGGSYKGIVVVGMGGSAIGGLFLRDLLSDEISIPIFIERGMRLPRFVDKNYFVVVVSYSGNTEETLRSLADAVGRGIEPVCITSDGLLERIAERKGFPLFKLPGGLQPRASFPYMAVALLTMLTYAGIVGLDAKGEIGRVALVLEKSRDSILGALSKEGSTLHLPGGGGGLLDAVSRVVCGATPVIYSYRPYVSPGYRAKTQFNENAKIHAFYSELPESNHNEIMGWSCEAATRFEPILVRGREEPEPMKHRMDFLEDLFSRIGGEPAVIRSSTVGRLAELFTLFFTVDAFSVAVALRRGVDPTPVETISELKKYLGERIDLERELGGLFS